MYCNYNDNLDGVFRISNSDNWSINNINTALKSYTILLNFGSEIVLNVDLENRNINRNEICFLNPGSYVSSVETKDSMHYFIDFNSAFYCLELHDKEVSCNGLLFGAMSNFPIIHTNSEEVDTNKLLISQLEKEFENLDSSQGDMLRLLLKRLIIICVRIAREQLFEESKPLLEDTDLVRKYQALVEKHFRNKHRVSEYADLLNKSPKTLSNTFKKLNGTNPLQIIQDRIILEAKRLLYYTDKPVKEIAYELGFSEPAHFSRLFKKISSKSPSDFQRKVFI